MKRKNIAGSSPWEKIVGYSRAVRVDNIVEISGTTAVLNGEVLGVGDAYLQTKKIIEIIKDVLLSENLSLENVVRTRIFVKNIENWRDIAKAHHESFGDILPVASMIEVSGFIDKEILVEIEVTAMI